MGYDRCVTICTPQTYTIIVNTCLYGLLSLLSLLISIVNALLHSLMVLHPSFCTDLEIPHFFCELAQIVNLACSDTIINYILVYFVATTGFGVYISSAFTHSSSETAVASVMYSVVPQMMNPFIYSLRNRDMTGALRKITIMAYDRYVAICHPLRYTIIMNLHCCGLLSLLSLLTSIVNALLHSLLVLHLSFCIDLEIPHFFCELAQILKLASCINYILVYFVATGWGGVPLSGIIFSYTRIFSSVLRMPSVGAKYKAFCTCGSHLSVVLIIWNNLWRVHQFCVYTFSQEDSSSLSDVQCGPSNDEFFYLQPEEQRHKGTLEDIHQ
nr:olfactory receptor 7G2-like [Loxodonta africana]